MVLSGFLYDLLVRILTVFNQGYRHDAKTKY